MPTVSVNRDLLFKALGRTFTEEEFDDLGFQFGIELDDVVDEPDKGVVYKIEVGANRYDLLCLEGIAQALNVYLRNSELPRYSLLPSQHPDKQRLLVQPSTAQVRPFVVGAVLRNLAFTQEIYDSFIDLQDKLHQNIARKRTLVAIGTHDLDTIEGPFIYDAKPPREISFIPLNKREEFDAEKLMELYLLDPHLRDYVPIIKDKPVYPVITDQRGVVLSLPPIINGNHSRITLNTTNVFIECTAVDKFKAQIVLDTLVCMISRYCEKPFTVEPVQVEYPNGEKLQYPTLQYRMQDTSVEYCNSLVGVEEKATDIARMLKSMCLSAKVVDEDRLEVEVPPTRYDILHECDVAEDFAVAYGFDRLAADKQMPPTNTVGQEFELNYYSDKLRLLLSQNNYTEVATFSLCSKADIGEKMKVNLGDEAWIQVGNPKTTECEALRTSLLPGVLKTAASNKHVSLPLRLFEIADVAVTSDDAEATRGTGAHNERHLCAINYNVRAGMEIVQGLLDGIMVGLKVSFSEEEDDHKGYFLVGKDHPSFFPGFCGRVVVQGEEVGYLGLVHPDVISNFNLSNPVSSLEINLEKIMQLIAA